MKSKKAAFEMSMTTVVIIVLAMTMLILGLVLIRTIFTGAQYNVQQMNAKVEGEINKLFIEEDQKMAIYLPNNLATTKQGQNFNVAFAVKNIEAASKKFKYSVTLASTGNCPKSTNVAKWAVIPLVGDSISFSLPSGDTYFDTVSMIPPLTTPLCTARFQIVINDETGIYSTSSYDVKITSK